MTHLITAPTFTFANGEENPINVDYYNGTITLRQKGAFEIPEEVIIQTDQFSKLVKEIQRHLPEATEVWERRLK